MTDTEVGTGPNRFFDLTPDPRILPMLGEINIKEWQCLAELVDNAVDGFLSAKRAGVEIQLPQVTIQTPNRDDPAAKITIKDNGPGMSPEMLERAARAGYSGNDPINNLGLFGMGFNIATARLGQRTTVYTTRATDQAWTGLQIDFRRLASQGNFQTERLTRLKFNSKDQGTEIVIEDLKPTVRTFFAKSGSRTKVSRDLARIYSTILQPNGIPIHFMLKMGDRALTARRHCVWDDSRTAQLPNIGEVSAIQTFNHALDSRPFCTDCWQWITAAAKQCPHCESLRIVLRERRIHGWVGLQRYADTSDYGLDFLRNGRKIEIANKDLFCWSSGDPGVDNDELEYPIDDPRGRGRFVGEIHLDHCRVAYTKDRFERNDPAWAQMVEVVRGEAPLRPQKATDLGFAPNTSPLSTLYQAFRRNSPHNSSGGGYARLVVVKDNDKAAGMAKQFHDGAPEYQTDTKWWALVQEADRDAIIPLGQRAGQRPSSLTSFTASSLSDTTGSTPDTSVPIPVVVQPTSEPSPERTPIAALGDLYVDDISQRRWRVQAFDVRASDPELKAPGEPWSLQTSNAGDTSFFVNASHSVFRSTTFTPLDALLSQLATRAVLEHPRSAGEPPSFALVLASLRAKYAMSTQLNPQALSGESNQALVDVARGVAGTMEPGEGRLFFDLLTEEDQRSTQRRMATQSVGNPQSVIDDGRFLEYAPRAVLLAFFRDNPELFFDGRFWDDPYASLDFGSVEVTDEARRRLVERYGGYLTDVIWLDEHDPAVLLAASRPQLIRAKAALDLLRAGIGEER